MIRCTCGAELFSIESVCSVCIHPKPPRAIYVEDLRIKLANREEEILDWKEATEIANNENIELRAERDRLAGEVERLKSQRDEYLQFWKNNAEACEAAEAERDRLKAALDEAVKWMDGCAVSGGYPTWHAKARKALGGDAS